MNGGFLLRKIKPVSIWASSQAVGYEIENAFDPNPSLIFRSLTGSFAVRINFAETLPDQHGIAIINHSLKTGDELSVKYYSDSGFSQLIATYSFPIREKNMYIIMNGAFTPYMKLSVTSTQDSHWFGVIYVGNVFTFPHNYSWGFEDEFIVEKEVEVSDYGYPIETPDDDDGWSAPEYHRFRITFDDVNRTYHSQYLQIIRPGKKVFFPSVASGECYYGIVPDTKLTAKKNKTGDTYSVSFLEAAVGESQ